MYLFFPGFSLYRLYIFFVRTIFPHSLDPFSSLRMCIYFSSSEFPKPLLYAFTLGVFMFVPIVYSFFFSPFLISHSFLRFSISFPQLIRLAFTAAWQLHSAVISDASLGWKDDHFSVVRISIRLSPSIESGFHWRYLPSFDSIKILPHGSVYFWLKCIYLSLLAELRHLLRRMEFF